MRFSILALLVSSELFAQRQIDFVDSNKSYLSLQEEILERLKSLKTEKKQLLREMDRLEAYCKSMTYEKADSVRAVSRVRLQKRSVEDRLKSVSAQVNALQSQLREIMDAIGGLWKFES